MKVRISYHGIEVEVDFGQPLPNTQVVGNNIKYQDTADKVAVTMVKECVKAVKELKEGGEG